jgi:hypothetical protein
MFSHLAGILNVQAQMLDVVNHCDITAGLAMMSANPSFQIQLLTTEIDY